MRRLIAPLAAALLVVAVTAPMAAATGGDPFTKSWSRTDVDGSRETLEFSGSGDGKTFHYTDWRATSCAGGLFESTGIVEVIGNVGSFDGAGGCVDGASGPVSGTYTYDTVSQTIDDGSGLLWHRGNGAREAFLGVWLATDLDGSSMKLTFRADDQLARIVSYLDDLASSCDPDAVWMSDGVGVIGSVPGQGRYITVSLHGGCMGADTIAYDEAYRYDVETDTLRGPLDLDGNELPWTVDWHRG